MPDLFTPAAEAELDDGLSIEGEFMDDADLADCDGPDIVMPDGIDEQRLLDALYRDLRRGEQAKAVLAEAEMQKVAKFNAQFEHRTIEGLGQLVASVPLDTFLYWCNREGAQFWHERSNLDYFAKRAGGTGNHGFFAKTRKSSAVRFENTLPRCEDAAADHEVGKPVGVAEKAAPTASAPKVRGRRGRWAA